MTWCAGEHYLHSRLQLQLFLVIPILTSTIELQRSSAKALSNATQDYDPPTWLLSSGFLIRAAKMTLNTPKTSMDDLFNSMRNLSMSNHDSRKAPSNDGSHLDQVNQELLRVSYEMIGRVQELQAALTGDGISFARRVAALSSLQKRTTELAAITSSVRVASKEYMVAQIFSLSKGNTDARRMSLFFEDGISRIVQNVLGINEDDETTLLRILEECYSQSAHTFGMLHPDQFFDAKEETFLESPYDPDFESEAYYEHENQLQVDESYAESERIRQRRETEKRAKDKRRITNTWLRFWLDQLHECKDGPTLFCPLSDWESCSNVPEFPEYLFRAFDESSSGKSDESVVASPASIHLAPDICRVDLLSLSQSMAARKIYDHLNKPCFEGINSDNSDNLMSWSSSLLFVIQYAIWRARKGRRPEERIMICAVDTSKFPRGQFVRDKWLFRKYCDEFSSQFQMKKFVDLRESAYDNGEYLSQGIVNHRNRSCMVSLGNLARNGLYELYPEFDDQDGGGKWTNRVKELRSLWETNHTIPRKDIRLAVQVANTCFRNFQTLDIAVLLLAFKSRRDPGKSAESKCCASKI